MVGTLWLPERRGDRYQKIESRLGQFWERLGVEHRMVVEVHASLGILNLKKLYLADYWQIIWLFFWLCFGSFSLGVFLSRHSQTSVLCRPRPQSQ